MTDFRRCSCCSGPLEPAQQLRFLVETAALDSPSFFDRIRRLPTRWGRPVPVCSGCQGRIEATPARSARSGVLAAVGILSVGWLVQTLLLGPRA